MRTCTGLISDRKFAKRKLGYLKAARIKRDRDGEDSDRHLVSLLCEIVELQESRIEYLEAMALGSPSM